MRTIWLSVVTALILGPVAFAETVTVQVKQGRIREAPRFFAPSVAKVTLGDRLEVVASSKDWFEVSFLHLRGWIHSSSVTTKKVSLTTTKTVGAETTAEEVTLAGKGFTKEVEDQYRSDHPSQNFAAVDEILRQQPSEKELEQFRRQGKLGEFGGEA